jgi:Trypsin-like peptidase domain
VLDCWLCISSPPCYFDGEMQFATGRMIMANLQIAIPTLRESTVAILSLTPKTPEKIKKGKVIPAQYNVTWGTAFSVVSDRYLVTAFHTLNGGNPRNPNTKFYALSVPGNGNPYYVFPIIGFPLERSDIDIAVLEIGPCTTAGIHLPAVPLTFAPKVDGTEVLTMGFPAPEVVNLNVDATHNFQSGQFFLKSSANEGILASQYLGTTLDGVNMFMYEFNVSWVHGESGGPVAVIRDNNQPTVISLMQNYRLATSPDGRKIPGPRRGISLSMIKPELEAMGVVGV